MLRRINICLCFLVAGVLLYPEGEKWYISHFSTPEISQEHLESENKVPVEVVETLPRSFTLDVEQYKMICGPFLSLESGKHCTQLPDLRSSLLYYGKNLRPDGIDNESTILIGFRSDPSLATIRTDEKIYIIPIKQPGLKWILSPENTQTSIWIVANPVESGLEVSVGMLDSDGNEVTSPAEYARFFVKEFPMPMICPNVVGWKIGELPVDFMLLQKQSARWYGKDAFIDMCGGEELSHNMSKECMQFRQQNNEYITYVQVHDVLVFENGQWMVQPIGEKTRGKPILVVKAIDDRKIFFDLWDEEGKRRFPLEVQKTQEPVLSFQNNHIKLLGARTATDCIVSLAGTRAQIRTDDWILFQKDACQIIASEEQVDDFVRGNLQGEMLILEGMHRGEKGSHLKGMLFSASRSQAIPVMIAMHTQVESANNKGSSESLKKQMISDDEDDDFEDEDINDEDDDEDDEEAYEQSYIQRT